VGKRIIGLVSFFPCYCWILGIAYRLVLLFYFFCLLQITQMFLAERALPFSSCTRPCLNNMYSYFCFAFTIFSDSWA